MTAQIPSLSEFAVASLGLLPRPPSRLHHEHLFCNPAKREISQLFLRLLGSEGLFQDALEEFTSLAYNSIAHCLDCSVQYHRFTKRFLASLDQELHEFSDLHAREWRRWEESRIRYCFTCIHDESRQPGALICLVPQRMSLLLLDVLRFPQCLSVDGFALSFEHFFLSFLSANPDFSFVHKSHVSAGVGYLAFHRNEKIMQWARSQLMQSFGQIMNHNDANIRILEMLFDAVNQYMSAKHECNPYLFHGDITEILRTISILFLDQVPPRISDEIIRHRLPSLPGTLCRCLVHHKPSTSSDLVSLLTRLLTRLLTVFGHDFWSNKACTPQTLMRSLTRNEHYVNLFIVQREKVDYRNDLEWIPSLLQTVPLSCQLQILDVFLDEMDKHIYKFDIHARDEIMNAVSQMKSIILRTHHSATITQERCSICFENLGSGNLGMLHCRHVFHLGCIKTWSQQFNTCPLDRTEFKEIVVKDWKRFVMERIPVTPRVTNDNSDVEDMMNDGQVQEDYIEECTYCEICGEYSREQDMLICELCGDGYHYDCCTLYFGSYLSSRLTKREPITPPPSVEHIVNLPCMPTEDYTCSICTEIQESAQSRPKHQRAAPKERVQACTIREGGRLVRLDDDNTGEAWRRTESSRDTRSLGVFKGDMKLVG